MLTLIALTLVACSTAVEPVDSSDSGTAAAPWVAPACPVFSAPTSVGSLQDADIDEASGLSGSGRSSEVFWVHNDSGDSARFFGLDGSGTPLGTWSLQGVTALDWEDMAHLAGGTGPRLFFADIGDNAAIRHSITLWQVEEPEVPAGAPTTHTVPATGYVLTYPDGPHNAETLLADPLRDELYIVAKVASGSTPVFRVPTLDATAVTTVEQVAALPTNTDTLPGSPLVTGGDVSPDGLWVVLVTYTSAFAWPRDPSQPLHTAFDNPPCELPRAEEPQGETIAFERDGLALRTVSEGAGSAIYRSTRAP